MIFTIQRYVEDYIQRRGLVDTDQYAIKVADFYARLDPDVTTSEKAHMLHRIRTNFFRSNTKLDRLSFESEVLKLLDGKYKKKASLLNFLVVWQEKNGYYRKRLGTQLSML